MKRKFLITLVAVAAALSMNLVVSAQTLQSPQPQDPVDVSDRELSGFVDAYQGVQKIQQELNDDVNGLVQESNFSQQSFNELYQAHMRQDSEQLAGMSSTERKEFEGLVDQINGLQNSMREKMIDTIADAGLSIEKFNTIGASLQQDSELYERFMEMAQN
jgi:peptidoglycan hydrolase CwlO-like protein